ncbi:MAG: hypothetical protein IPJ21_06025 [Sterolibacteriaceae bacterium]|nr:hypothetical protein [Sterolibacteriaceae bacterium]MBK9087203.1 hypothetical protein [Sterolibacteriaceae bacterium]
MMAEDGIDDFGYAKRKAARQLGLPEVGALPTNTEVEAELRTYLALYQSEEQPALLMELRSVAIAAMRFLADFNPYLTGPVLDGTAGRYAEVELELFAESAKEVEIFLINHNIRYEHGRIPQGPGELPEAVLHLDWDATPLRLNIYSELAERSKRTNRAGKVRDRARIGIVVSLLKGSGQ